MGDNAAEQGFELVGIEALIHAAPIDGIVGEGVVDGELVAGAAARARAGHGDQSAVGGEARFTAQQCAFNELSRREIAVDLGSGG